MKKVIKKEIELHNVNEVVPFIDIKTGKENKFNLILYLTMLLLILPTLTGLLLFWFEI